MAFRRLLNASRPLRFIGGGSIALVVTGASMSNKDAVHCKGITLKRTLSSESHTTPGGVILAADIGGTNSRMMLYYVAEGSEIKRQVAPPGELIYEFTYPNIEFKSMDEIVAKFLREASAHAKSNGKRDPGIPDVACMAVAGVVTENRCRLTNIAWTISGSELEDKVGISRVEVPQYVW